MTNDITLAVEDILDDTYNTRARKRITSHNSDPNKGELIRFDLERTQDLLRAILSVLTPEQLVVIHSEIKPAF